MNKNIAREFQQDRQKFQHFVQTAKDKEIIALLKQFGRLAEDFDVETNLIELLSSENKEIRLEGILNLAKRGNIDLLPVFVDYLKKEKLSELRKEAASAIGRMRASQAIPTLCDLLDDYDPNVILQAIRGLLVFKQQPEIETRLKALFDHKNEMIQNVVAAEFSADKSQKKSAPHKCSPAYLHNCVECRYT